MDPSHDSRPPEERRNCLIDEFCAITGTDPGRAGLYLSASGWDSDLAVSSFYEEGDERGSQDGPPSEPPPPLPFFTETSARFATLSSIMQNADKEDEEEGQAFYAGGSERSGQQVLGPGKRKTGSSIAEEMFKAAKSHGAEVVEPTETRPAATHLRAFGGTGYVLGSNSEDTRIVSNPGAGAVEKPVFITLRVYKTGFTVDDGPFRKFADAENKDFLDSIRHGEVPMELRERAKNAEINLNMEDHSHEEYAPPKLSVQAFAGEGHRLGSPTPPIAGTASPAECQRNEKEAQEHLKVDESESITNTQVRLADGSRLVLKLNFGHSVGDIRRYIITARPEYSASIFSLMVAYPNRELLDDNATVKEENLMNAVIVQKLK